MTGSAIVYVMQADDGRVKVGYSQQADFRRKQMQLQKKIKLTVIHSTESTPKAKWVEKEALTRLRYVRGMSRGEWFDLPPETAVEAVDETPQISY